MDDWNSKMIAKVMADFPKLSRETRLFLAKAVTLFQDALQKEKGQSKAPHAVLVTPRKLARTKAEREHQTMEGLANE